MKLFDKVLARDVVFIAEVGVNHEGSVDAASRMLGLAAEAGADAVKLQSYTPERYVSSSQPERLARVRQFALDAAAHRRLAGEARELGIALFSTPLSEDWVPLLDEMFPAFKIASGDITFEPTIRAAARTGKPVILSTGAATPEDIDRAVGWLREEMGEAMSERLVLMQCTSAYPTAIEEAGVAGVRWLAERYGVTVGYSNHVIGPEACLAAIALGARVIEVHFTDCKTGRSFRDHELSFEADDLRSLITAGRRVKAAVGLPTKTVQASELDTCPLIRKGVVAARALSAGSRLSADDLIFARPATGFPAERVGELVGRRLVVSLAAGESLRPEHLAPTEP